MENIKIKNKNITKKELIIKELINIMKKYDIDIIKLKNIINNLIDEGFFEDVKYENNQYIIEDVKYENNEDVKEFNIRDIISDEVLINNYIQKLNEYIKTKIKIYELINYARNICIGLPTNKEIFTIYNNDKSIKDKGLFGKLIEFALFGIKQNSKSEPDIPKLGYDIKTCVFKKLTNNCKNAKERQTMVNCGDTKNYESFKDIYDNDKFENCKHYQKCRKFILFIRNDDKIKLKTFDQMLQQSMLFITFFNIGKLPIDIIDIINNDYKKIRKSIIEQTVSQKGQTYLHIHPHGNGHGSQSRAFGFTSKFITYIVALKISEIYNKDLENIIIKKGRSTSIKKEYL